MKVNFDQLFASEPAHSIDPQLAQSAFQLTPLNKSIRLNETIQTQEQTTRPPQQQPSYEPSQPSYEPSYVEEEESIRQILQFKLALALQQEQQRQEHQARVKTLPSPSLDFKEVTNRLYGHTPCDHKCCQDYKMDKQIKEQAEQLWLKEHNLRYKAAHPKRASEEQSALSERLHSHANYRRIKILQLQLRQNKLEKQKFVGRRFSNNQSYLEGYVPFYDRLESEVRKSREKQKLYQLDPFLAEQPSQPYFKPAKYAQKYQDVQSRYWRDQSQYCERLSYYDEVGCSSINTSQMSVLSLDRSIELVNSVEEYFVEKMKCIFVDRGKECISVGEEQVTLMTDVEWRILQPFVMQLEEGSTPNGQFQNKLRGFLQKLDFRDKQELRSHQTKARKAIMKKEGPSRKQQALHCTKSSLSTKCKPARASKYLSKFQNYV